jgi:hypothetical protein
MSPVLKHWDGFRWGLLTFKSTATFKLAPFTPISDAPLAV